MHLGMTGRFLIEGTLNLDRRQPAPLAKHAHVVFETDDARIVFEDARRFGFMDLTPTAGLPDHPRLASLGPEPFDDIFAEPYLAEAFAGRRQEFVEEVASWTAEAKQQGARFYDVFCDEGAFTVVESGQLLRRARAAGLELRLHADELALTGGTELAVQLGAVSADHLLCISAAEIAALARSSTVATLCPVTALAMGRTPPARELLAAGVTVALGSDHNPGTSGATSMSLIVWLATAELGLSVEQALTAATAGGARSLALPDRGQIVPGMVADLVLWDTDHEGGFAWSPDLRPLQVWRAGRASRGIQPG